VYAVGDWTFRFPRHAGVVPWLEREIGLMPLVEGALSSFVPHFEKLGTLCERFPHPFVGYRRLPGVPVDRAPVSHGALARELGAALTRVHSIDGASIAQTPDRSEQETWEDWRSYDDEDVFDILEILPAALHGAVEPFLSAKLARPPFEGPRLFIYNDISRDHVLVDPGTGSSPP
jgi:aminoglycoside phosphotransferase (APT) family kinase protein